MPPRTLSGPVVHAEPGGFTFLSGPNVDLAPPRLAAITARFVGAARRHGAGTIGFLAFEGTRGGLVGCRGVLHADGRGGTEVADLEAFGSDPGLSAFGVALGRFLLDGGCAAIAADGTEPVGRTQSLELALSEAGLSRGSPQAPAP